MPYLADEGEIRLVQDDDGRADLQARGEGGASTSRRVQHILPAIYNMCRHMSRHQTMYSKSSPFAKHPLGTTHIFHTCHSTSSCFESRA